MVGTREEGLLGREAAVCQALKCRLQCLCPWWNLHLCHPGARYANSEHTVVALDHSK